jgi:hypothetical protein
MKLLLAWGPPYSNTRSYNIRPTILRPPFLTPVLRLRSARLDRILPQRILSKDRWSINVRECVKKVGAREETKQISTFSSKMDQSLVGRRVQIRAVKSEGSARFLNGLTGRVVAKHPIAPNWVVVALDCNARTHHLEWGIPIESLTVFDDQLPTQS